MAEAQAPIPQALSSEVAKAAVLPDVLKHAPIDWNRVKKVDQGLDNIPEIHARGAVIKVEEQADANDMRDGTKIKVGEKETNLVDHVLQDEQLRVLMQEGMRLGIVTEADFKAIGVGPEMYLKGEKTGLKIPELDRLQKAEAINFLLSGLGNRNDRTSSLFLDEASKLILNPKDVKLLNEVGGVLDNQDLLNALAAGGREELSKYIVETGYQPHSMAGKELRERRVLAKLVKKSYGKEGAGRILSDETPYFAESATVDSEGKLEKSPVAEYSGVVDLHIAQAMTNAMMPPEFHTTIAGLEKQVSMSRDVSEIADLQHQITQTRQKAYAALLNAFGVEGYQLDGKAMTDYGFGAQDQLDIDRMAKAIKESPRFKETQTMTMFEANRFSLVETTAKITGLNPDKLKGVIMALPIEQTVETLREQARANMVSEDGVESTVRKQLAGEFVRMIDSANTLGQGDIYFGRVTALEAANIQKLTADQRDQLERFFLNTYDTERSLIKKGHKRFKEADAPTKMKIGTPEAINQGVKGLQLLFKRSISEAQYDYETYKKLVIEGAANPPEPVPGAVLEQGEMKNVADEKGKAQIEADLAKAAEELDKQVKAAEEERNRTKLAVDAATQQERKNQQEVAQQQVKEAAETATRQARLPEQSIDLPALNGAEGLTELDLRIDLGEVTSAQIQQAENRVRGIPDQLGHFGFLRKWGADAILTPEKKTQLADLRKAHEYALQVEERRRAEARAERERAEALQEAQALLRERGSLAEENVVVSAAPATTFEDVEKRDEFPAPDSVRYPDLLEK
ncbi:MAG: hypothetical protein WCT22_00250 [Patescibacteria group bacterium]